MLTRGRGALSYPFLFYGIILVALRYAFLWLLKLLVKIAIVSIGFGHTVWRGVVCMLMLVILQTRSRSISSM